MSILRQQSNQIPKISLHDLHYQKQNHSISSKTFQE